MLVYNFFLKKNDFKYRFVLKKSLSLVFIFFSFFSFAQVDPGSDWSQCNNCDVETDPSQYSAYASPGNTTYYISYSSGSDSNDGLSESNPFKNLGKINSITFSAGDIIKFNKGDIWYGYFKILHSLSFLLIFLTFFRKL